MARSKEGIRVRCMLHNGDHGKNLCINIAKKVAHCKVCDFKGDIIKLYMEATGKSFREAVQELAGIINFELQYEGVARFDKDALVARTPQQVIDESTELISHPYATRKRIDICRGLYAGVDDRNNSAIIIPFWDVDDNLQTVQFVHDNYKGFKGGGGYKTGGAFFVVDQREIRDGDFVLLAEKGLATASTIWMASNKKVTVVSFGLQPIWYMLHVQYGVDIPT